MGCPAVPHLIHDHRNFVLHVGDNGSFIITKSVGVDHRIAIYRAVLAFSSIDRAGRGQNRRGIIRSEDASPPVVHQQESRVVGAG